MTEKSGQLKEAIEVLKRLDVVHGGTYSYAIKEAIDTVVAELEKPLSTINESGIIALNISETLEHKLTAQEQAFFVAGFQECIKYLNKGSACLNTENIRGLDENLDENVIEQSDNQEGLSNNKNRKFIPELLQTHYPFLVEMDELLTRKKLGMPTIIKAQSIITRCHLHGMEVGYEAALRFKEMQK